MQVNLLSMKNGSNGSDYKIKMFTVIKIHKQIYEGNLNSEQYCTEDKNQSYLVYFPSTNN